MNFSGQFPKPEPERTLAAIYEDHLKFRGYLVSTNYIHILKALFNYGSTSPYFQVITSVKEELNQTSSFASLIKDSDFPVDSNLELTKYVVAK